MSKLTPRPWFAISSAKLNSGFAVKVKEGQRSNYIEIHFAQHDASAEADAAHIVKCVNMHDEMLAALKAMNEYTHADQKDSIRAKAADRFDREQIWAMVRAVIAKAEDK